MQVINRRGCVVAFEEVGIDRRGEGRIVELDGMLGAVVLRGPAPGGTDLGSSGGASRSYYEISSREKHD